MSLTFLRRQVEQKKKMKRQKEKLDALRREEEEEREKVKKLARERVLKEFERSQAGVFVSKKDTDKSDADAGK